MRRRLARAADLALGILPEQHGRDRRRLGAAVDLADRHPPRMEGADERVWHHHRAAVEHAQRRQVGALPRRMPDYRLHRRRHEEGEGRLAACHVLEPRAGLEAPVERDCSAGEQGRERLVVQPAHMEHRQRREHVIGLAQVVRVDRVEAVPEQRRLRQHRAFGLACRPRGVDDQQLIGIAAFVRTLPFIAGRSDRNTQGPCLSRERLIMKDPARPAVLEDRAMLGGGKAPVERHQDRAAAREREKQHQHLRAVVAKPGHAVAFADLECFRSRIDEIPKLLVRKIKPLKMQGRLGREVVGPALDDARKVQSSLSPGS